MEKGTWNSKGANPLVFSALCTCSSTFNYENDGCHLVVYGSASSVLEPWVSDGTLGKDDRQSTFHSESSEFQVGIPDGQRRAP